METTLYRKLPSVSAGGTMLLAGIGLVCLLMGLAAGAILLVPAALSCGAGMVTGIVRAVRVWRGKAVAHEGTFALLSATFVNATLTFFAVFAAYILLRFGP